MRYQMRVRSVTMSAVLRSTLIVVLTVLAAVLVAPATASAAPTKVGYDVSYPQCGSSLPRDRAFAVIGVNGGLSTRANPCLREQLLWAWNSSGAVTAQPRAQVYLNTANPGELRTQLTTWPARGTTPYGACDGSNSAACSWQYGRERAQNSVLSFFTPAARAARGDRAPSRYTWWLDVETMNTWQSGSDAGRARNRATLEGMTDYLTGRGAQVGVYSTGYQWGRIVGDVPAQSPLYELDSWLAGSLTRSGAEATCRRAPLVEGGQVVLTQYVDDGLDHDHACG